MNGNDRQRGERSLTPVIVGLLVACGILLVVVIVLGVIYLTSREPDELPPTVTSVLAEAASATPAPTAGDDGLDVLIPDTTKVLSGITIDKLASISEDGSVYTFTGTTPELEALAAGDVIAGDAWEQTPYGFLRKVTGITAEGQQVVVRTDQARLEDAIEQGVVQASREMTPGDVRAGTQLPGVELVYTGTRLGTSANAFVVELDDVVLLDLDGNLDTTGDQARANGRLSFQPRFDFDLQLRGFAIQRLSAVSGATEHVDLSITADLQLPDAHEEVQVAYYLLQPITVWVGWVPVVFTPVLTVDVGLDGTAVVGFDVGVAQEANLNVGLVYANGGWSPIAEFTNDFEFTPPTISANCQVRGYAGVELAILIYGVGGPHGQLDGFLELDADLNRDPWWELYGGLGATAGVQFEVLGYRLADYEKRVLEKRFALSQGGARPTELPPTVEPSPTIKPPQPTTPVPPTPTFTATPEPTTDCAFGPAGEFAALWQTYKGQLGCPLTAAPKLIQDAEQAFENGRMFWRDDNQYIYVLYEQGAQAGTYLVFEDEWEEGDPEFSCVATAPAYRVQPKRGFGLVWCKLGGPAAAIGWGLAEEIGYWEGLGDPLVQDFESGVIFRGGEGTAHGTAYVFFGPTGTFVHETY